MSDHIYKTVTINVVLGGDHRLQITGSPNHGDMILRGEKSNDVITICDFDLSEENVDTLITAFKTFKKDYFSDED